MRSVPIRCFFLVMKIRRLVVTCILMRSRAPGTVWARTVTIPSLYTLRGDTTIVSGGATPARRGDPDSLPVLRTAALRAAAVARARATVRARTMAVALARAMAVALARASVAEDGAAVATGGTGMAVLSGGTGVLAGGTAVLAGGTGVLASGAAVLAGRASGTGVFVAVGAGVFVGVSVGVAVGGGGTDVSRVRASWLPLDSV